MRAATFDPLTVYSQQRQERRRVDELLVTVESVFHLSASRGWDAAVSLRLVPSLRELADRLGMLFALEEGDGYFDEELAVAPRLCEQVRKLQEQHRTLFAACCEIGDEADRILHHLLFVHLLERVEGRFATFAAEYRAHDDAERDLLLQALDDDIGVGD